MTRRVEQQHHFIYHALGIPPETQYDVEQRPFYTTPDGKGEAVMELFAQFKGLTFYCESEAFDAFYVPISSAEFILFLVW